MIMPVLPTKVLAYLRAAEVLAAAKAERGLYPRTVAAEINRELKKISARLNGAAKAAYRREKMNQFFAENPEKHKLYKQACALDRWKAAERHLIKVGKETGALGQ